jgi:hypothetical protein
MKRRTYFFESRLHKEPELVPTLCVGMPSSTLRVASQAAIDRLIRLKEPLDLACKVPGNRR